MYNPRAFDTLTLEYIQKPMNTEALEKAEKLGLFDLLKSNLHPEKVLVHGKHGDSPFETRRAQKHTMLKRRRSPIWARSIS